MQFRLVGTDGLARFVAMKRKSTASGKTPAKMMDSVQSLDAVLEGPAEAHASGDVSLASPDNLVSNAPAEPLASGVLAPAPSLAAPGVSSPGSSGVPVAFHCRRKTSASRRAVAMCPVECGIYLYTSDGSYINEWFEPLLPGFAISVAQQGSRVAWQKRGGLKQASCLQSHLQVPSPT
jgi:hypothetical protein